MGFWKTRFFRFEREGIHQSTWRMAKIASRDRVLLHSGMEIRGRAWFVLLIVVIACLPATRKPLSIATDFSWWVGVVAVLVSTHIIRFAFALADSNEDVPRLTPRIRNSHHHPKRSLLIYLGQYIHARRADLFAFFNSNTNILSEVFFTVPRRQNWTTLQVIL